MRNTGRGLVALALAILLAAIGSQARASEPYQAIDPSRVVQNSVVGPHDLADLVVDTTAFEARSVHVPRVLGEGPRASSAPTGAAPARGAVQAPSGAAPSRGAVRAPSGARRVGGARRISGAR